MTPSFQRKFPWHVYRRIVIAQSLLVLLALVASGFLGKYFFKKFFTDHLEQQLKDSALILSRSLPHPPPANWCNEAAAGTQMRLTLIHRDGTVLCDSHSTARSMENHSDRPELVEAAREGYGASFRFSETIQETLLYCALYLKDRDLYLRAAFPWSPLLRMIHSFESRKKEIHATLKGVDHAFPWSPLLRMIHSFESRMNLFLALGGLVLLVMITWSSRKLVNPLGGLLVLTKNPQEGGGSGGGNFGEWKELASSIEFIQRDLVSTTESLDWARDQISTLMDGISDGVLAIDTHRKPLFVNTRFTKFFDVNFKESTISLQSIFRDPQIVAAFERALAGTPARVETTQVEHAGIVRHFSYSVYPLNNPARSGQAAVGFFRDITELVNVEKMRIDFVANVSHELRTPLTSIKGYSATLLQDAKDHKPVAIDYLEIIDRNTDQLMKLISDLLELSYLDFNPNSLDKTQVDVREITQRLLQKMQPMFADKEQNVEAHVNAPYLVADYFRLEQVMTNLIENAHKFTPVGGKITVRWDVEEDRIVLRVTDNGPGIDPAHHARLFERFYRVDKARSRRLGGTGLGLSIVKHIMRLHGGSVSVKSEVGQGSTFVCQFPRYAAPSAEI